MKRSPIIFLPLLFAFGLLVWFLRTEDPSEPLDQTPKATQDMQTAAAGDNLVEPTAENSARSQVEAPKTETEEPAQVLKQGESWLEGRVEFPAGQAWEESLTVYVLSMRVDRGDLDGVFLGEDPEDDGDRVGALLDEAFTFTSEETLLTETRVQPDGTFRVALPNWHHSMHVQVLGRHLYMERAIPVARPPWNDPMVLRPNAGVWIHGKLHAPAGMEWEGRSALVRLYKEISPLNALVPGGGPAVGTYLSRSDAQGSFELRGIPVEEHAQLQVRPKQGAPLLRDLEAFQKGGTITLDINLPQGRTVTGRVLDPAGNPVEGAEVASFSQAPLAQARGPYRKDFTDDAGQFTLVALPEEPLIVRARHPDWVHSDKFRIEGKGNVQDVVLTMKEGAFLAGVLLYPDGTPAPDVVVVANLDGVHVNGMEGIGMVEHMGSRAVSTTDGQGRFHLKGLANLPYKLAAKTEWKSQVVRGFLDDQRPSEAPLELQLRPSLSLAGHVKDAEGRPVTEFMLLAREARAAEMFTVYVNDRVKHFAAEDGSFQLSDLVAGRWQIQVQGDGFVLDPPFEVDLPQGENAAPIVLTVTQALTLTGTVVDPEGRPIPGAQVRAQVQGIEALQRLGESRLTPKGLSDAEGRFTIGPMPVQPVSLVASAPDWCDSESLAVEPVEGVPMPEITLALRRGGTLIAEVFGEDGELAANRMITVNSPKNPGKSENGLTDADGQAIFEHLAPGNYNVVALGDAGKMMRNLDEGTLNQTEILKNMKLANADVKEGEEVRVTLGSAPAQPIQIHGRVTRGGEPISEAFVSFNSNGRSLLDSLALSEVKNGEYQTTLDGEGRYRITVQITGGNMLQQTTTEFVRDIAYAEEIELNLEMPEGTIAGVVLDPHGKPAPRVRISVQASGPTPTSTLLGGSFVERQTGEDGTFEVSGLQEGTYTVFAGGSVPYGLGSAEGPAHGRVASAPIHLRKDQSVNGVRLRLETPGSIRCRVVDDSGAGVEGASLFVRDSSGRPLEAFSLVTSDATGWCTYKGLAPGEYTVSARNSELASTESNPI
ncbi:MAG: carboxypeptidase regulatory-like domain-containing protein, partial [Planctomycetes bacterium]|nr:carboxypeptidase regulatory-like domain-containing protein [Planctomycetota bacterium]